MIVKVNRVRSCLKVNAKNGKVSLLELRVDEAPKEELHFSEMSFGINQVEQLFGELSSIRKRNHEIVRLLDSPVEDEMRNRPNYTQHPSSFLFFSGGPRPLC